MKAHIGINREGSFFKSHLILLTSKNRVLEKEGTIPFTLEIRDQEPEFHSRSLQLTHCSFVLSLQALQEIYYSRPSRCMVLLWGEPMVCWCVLVGYRCRLISSLLCVRYLSYVSVKWLRWR